MKVLVKGYGSIGRRHAQNLENLAVPFVVQTRFPDDSGCLFTDVAPDDFDYAVLATPTSDHLPDLEALSAGSCKNFLIEKPICATKEDLAAMERLAAERELDIRVAYNMRFLGIMTELEELIARRRHDMRIVHISAGSYLPTWRPDRDYRESYSAHRSRGGGVDLDLSHEFDYALFLFGAPRRRISFHCANLSRLEIQSPDYCHALFEHDGFVLHIELDYFRARERRIRILGENEVIAEVDFINGGYQGLVRPDLFDMNGSYVEEMRAFLGLSEARERLTSFEQSAQVLSQI